MLRFFIFCLSFTFFSRVFASSECASATKDYLAFAADYSSSFFTYESICEGGGLSSVESCQDTGYYCWYYGYHYYDASAEFMVDFPELAECVNYIDDCNGNTVENFSSECYICQRYLLYFVDAIDTGSVSFDRDCSSSSRADCYEYDAYVACQNATQECLQGWNSQCISYRDLVWIDYSNACGAMKSYIESCESATLTDYCNTLTGDESYTSLQCDKYMSQLDFCPLTVDAADQLSLSSIREFVSDVENQKLVKFQSCMKDINVNVPVPEIEFETKVGMSSETPNLGVLFPIITAFVGLLVGIVIGKRATFSKNYTQISSETKNLA